MIALALWRFLGRTPWSTFVAVLGVSLGVTSIVSVHLISATVALRLDALIPSQLVGFDYFLHRQQLQASDYFALRKAWRAGAAGNISELAPLIDETMELDGRSVRIIGVDLFTAEAGLDAVAAQAQSANSPTQSFSWLGVWVDESLRDHIKEPINGIIAAPEGTLVADISVAQDLLEWPASRLSYVGARFADPWSQVRALGENLLPGFGAGLPESRPTVIEQPGNEGDAGLDGWQVVSLASAHPASQFGKSVLFNISALGLLALLVSWFLMYQVAVSWLRRLWPVFQRLHVLGVGWAELRAYFLIAMAVLGLISAGVGLLGGQWLAEQLYQMATKSAAIDFAVDKWVIAKAVLSAVGVCFVGGLWAFRQARRASGNDRKAIWLALVLLSVALVGVLVPATGLAGGFFSIAVLSVVAALLVKPLLSRARHFSPWIRGPYLVRLSVREAVWYPQDLAVALAGLTLAVATAIGVGLMIDSFREDFSRMLERRLSYDLVAQGSDQALRRLVDVVDVKAGVSRVQSYSQLQTRVQGVPVQVTVGRLDRAEMARYGLPRALAANELIISEQGARALRTDEGDELSVAGQAFIIAGVFASFGDIAPRLIVDRKSPLAALAQDLDSVSISSSAPEQLLVALRKQFPALRLQLQTELRRNALDTFDQTFAITMVLILIAMIVASIGVYVAVTALRLNKKTSSHLLLGMGVNRFESVGMDFALGIGIGVVAMLLAVPLGAGFGWILCSVINPRAFGWTVQLQFSAQALLMPVFWGLLAAAVAGVIRIGRGEEGFAGGS